MLCYSAGLDWADNVVDTAIYEMGLAPEGDCIALTGCICENHRYDFQVADELPTDQSVRCVKEYLALLLCHCVARQRVHSARFNKFIIPGPLAISL
jgi:hypothetical protein